MNRIQSELRWNLSQLPNTGFRCIDGNHCSVNLMRYVTYCVCDYERVKLKAVS